MKTLLLLTLGLGIGMAQGQTNGTWEAAKTFPPSDISISDSFCGQSLHLGKSSKAIKDIFPGECAPKTEAKTPEWV